MGAGITHLRSEGRRIRRLLGRECLWPGRAAGAKLTSVSAGNCHNRGVSLQDQPHLEDGTGDLNRRQATIGWWLALRPLLSSVAAACRRTLSG